MSRMWRWTIGGEDTVTIASRRFQMLWQSLFARQRVSRLISVTSGPAIRVSHARVVASMNSTSGHRARQHHYPPSRPFLRSVFLRGSSLGDRSAWGFSRFAACVSTRHSAYVSTTLR